MFCLKISANERHNEIISIIPLVQQYWLYRKLIPMPSMANTLNVYSYHSKHVHMLGCLCDTIDLRINEQAMEREWDAECG